MKRSASWVLNSRSKAVILASATAVATLLSLYSLSLAADNPGEVIFNQKCKSCHTIGGGRAVGPDLEFITDKRERGWLIRFTIAPDEVAAQGDPIAKQLLQEYSIAMPKTGVSEREAEAVLAYIAAQSGTNVPRIAAAAQPVAGGEKGDFRLGESLFVGATSLDKGGPACIACHNIAGIGGLGGGTIAKDLTASYEDLGADVVTAILEAPDFPMMREAFADHPLTEREQAHLLAFLEQAGSAGGAVAADAGLQFGGLGVTGTLLLSFIGPLVWRRRLQGVRRLLIEGGVR